MKPVNKIPTGQRWLIASFAVLCIAALAFSTFVTNRSKSLREGDQASRRDEQTSRAEKDRLLRHYDENHRVLSDDEYVAAAKASEQRLLDRLSNQKRYREERLRQNRDEVRVKWERDVAQLRSDIQKLDKSEPGMTGDLKAKLKRMLADSPR
ncbi:MAG: hypothetical protein AAF497_03725 [Planctomycetota bacterium]